jgi:hypothetical protein
MLASQPFFAADAPGGTTFHGAVFPPSAGNLGAL